ncbi:hypothetical protein Tco_0972794, partial [Tanacetum coccineum]
NSDDTTDKSLSGTAMQSVVQPKAPTGKKSKKKKIASSSDPKTLHRVSKSKSNETVDEAQHAEKLVATADTPKGLDASESAEDVDFEQEMKDQVNDDVEITFLGATAFDQNMEEVESDVEFMPDDEIRSISGYDNCRIVERG